MNTLLWRFVGVAVMIGVGSWGGYKASSAVYEPKIAALEAKVVAAKQETKTANDRADSFQQAYSNIASAAQKQNEEVAKAVAQANEREKQAADAIKKAKSDSASYQAQAAAILMAQPPVGANECTAAAAARTAFDFELKSERGKQP